MFNKDEVFVGVAPINWSNDDLPELGGHIPVEQCLDEMQEAGYAGCEVGIKFPKDPIELKKLLEPRNLQVCNQWASYKFSTEPFEVVKEEFITLLGFLSAMGAKVVGGGEIGTSIQGDRNTRLYEDKPYNTPQQWKDLCNGLNQLGKLSKEEYGITLCFHHHMGTCVQTMEEIEILLHETNDTYVSLNYDCGHIFASDDDPAVAMQKFASRVGHVHIKDVRAPIVELVKQKQLSFIDGILEGFFTIPGDGNIGEDAYQVIFDSLDTVGYKGWIVLEAEQDPDKAPPLEYAKRGREFIARYTGL